MMQPEKVRFQLRRRVWSWVVSGLILALVSCQQVDAAANLGHNAAVLFNSGTGFDSPNQEGGHRRESGIFTSVSRHKCAFSMVGRGGEASACRFLLAGLSTSPRACHPRLTAGGGFKPKKEATMPKLTRALSRLFTAAYPVAHFPTESEAVLFARQYLAQTGRAVAVTPVSLGFDVIGGAA